MKLIATVGLPASGKTTWAREWCSNNKGWIRINRDDLRNMRGEYWIPKQEKLITAWENSLIIHTFQGGYNVVLDATNLNSERNKQRFEAIKKESGIDFSIEYKKFDTPLDECISRDKNRCNSVGESVIRGMYEKYLWEKPVYNEDPSLPHCVIFDLDGTLAKMNGRSPFDWNRVKEDSVNEPIRFICNTLQHSHSTIIFTGRDGSCLKDTVEWLNDHLIAFDRIFIRPEGNTEKDAIIKRRLFEENIRGKYYVDFVVDDRDQVVDMWRRELGLTCLQVDYGNF